jgi:hypothetical protein
VSGNFQRHLAALFFGLLLASAGAQTSSNLPPARVITSEGGVEYLRRDSTNWYSAPAGQVLEERDRLRTLDDGRAVVQLSDRSQLRLNPRSELTVTPARTASAKSHVELMRGLLYFLDRNRPGEIEVDTPLATAAIEGTEFALAVDETTGALMLALVDGRVQLTNTFGGISLVSGEQAVVEPGQPPRKTAVITSQNVVQWCLYYPGVIDVDELNFSDAEKLQFAGSLAAYRSGDLLAAREKFPRGSPLLGEAGLVYQAALDLSVGELAAAQNLPASPQAEALREVIAAVKNQPRPSTLNPQPSTASGWLAESYWLQSQFKLAEALVAARNAAAKSPNFGFAWARVAELEFSFGRTDAARTALEKSLSLAPRNAQAVALMGFLKLARDETTNAVASFETAMQLDPMLSNPWLGRGLARIHAGQAVEGRADLQTAATLEPDRWLLRSYLGKAYAHEVLFTRDANLRAELRSLAEEQLNLAKRHDPGDPTPWLYAALLEYDGYRSTEAIHDLEESQRLNDNRQLYRSRLLLDQDQAVRGANLAQIFADAGMTDVSLRESARAADSDYANYSAHLNLAASFDALRDPTRFNLRYESEWFNEHLLASLLAPVGAVSLSQNLSQQEYSRLFADKKFGGSSTTEFFSDGQWRETASQYGTFDQTSYALDLEYQHDDGVRVNNDLSRLEWYSRIKQQITPADSALVLVKYEDYDAGDNFQYYNPSSARPNYRFDESQTPLLLAGWHHEWSPGNHTLFLGGRLINGQNFSDLAAPQLIAVVNPVGIYDPATVPFDVSYHNQFEIYSAELNQIIEREKNTDIFGARFQSGTFKAAATFDNPPAADAPLFSLPVNSSTDANFHRLSFYEYHHMKLRDDFLLIGGVSYDHLRYPDNFRRPPLDSREAERDHVSPKAALIWTPSPSVTVRGIYAQAVGGVSYDESVRLEPTQLAGFGQSFRSLISESIVGSVEAPDYEIAGGAVDLKLATNSWLSLQGESLRGELNRELGLFDYDAFGSPAATPAGTSEHLDYHELNARAVFNQIIGREWFVEAGYQFSRSELEVGFPAIPATAGYQRTTTTRADLHQFDLAATWRSPSGFFSRGEFKWYCQQLGGDGTQPPGDDFPQLNLYAGYRFPQRRGELTVGVLNITGQDYRLSPLNYYLEMPREPVFYTRLRLNF